MVKRTGPTNPFVRMTIRMLKKASKEYGAPIWAAVAELLQKPRRKRIHVNLSKINRYTKPNELVIVPGKVLGSGNINHPVKVAALSFSRTAVKKIKNAGGECLTYRQLIEISPQGSHVKVIG